MQKPLLERQELNELLTFTRALARGGGAIALSYFGRAHPSLKYDQSLVTEADIAVQNFIQNEIKAAYPDHLFLGEEGPLSNSDEIPEKPVWVVDPVDGTAAFSSSMPVWGVAISLFDNGVPVIGVYYQPVTEELYSATKGGPAYLNDRRIEVLANNELDNESLMLAYSRFHNDYTTNFPGKIRSLGSSVAHICYVARGAAWGALLNNVHIWDLAAGVVILDSAGGKLRGFDNKDINLSNYLLNPGAKVEPILLASTNGQHKQASRYFKLINQ